MTGTRTRLGSGLSAVDGASTAGGPPDLRLLAVGAAAWAGAWAGQVGLPGASGAELAGGAVPLGVLLGGSLCLWFLLRRRGLRRGVTRGVREACGMVAHPSVRALAALAAVALGFLVSSGSRSGALETGAVARLAAEGRPVTVTAEVVSDARATSGGFAPGAWVRLRVREVRSAEGAWRTREPVLVTGGTEWLDVGLGSRVTVRGMLVAGTDGRGPLLRARGAPQVVDAPDVWWRAAAVVRAGIVTAVEPRAEAPRALVPSLVMGDDSAVDQELADDFATTGLTHLLAVSGTNLTLLLGAGLLVARACGVRGRGAWVVGACCIVGFVLLARTEPSVVRAAAMGTVALVALTHNGRNRGVRCLGAAVVLVLVLDPSMAVSVGFTLSVLATGGILLLAPVWGAALGRWLPRPVALAVAVPAAAQLAVTPVVAAISDEVSLVAVLTNVLVAPAVAPATVLGLLGGLLAVAWPWAGQVVAASAAWAVAWIVAVARWGADLPTASVGWRGTPPALVVLTLLCLALAAVAPWVLGRRAVSVPLVVCCAVVVLVPRPSPGWPPPGWVVAACDVGQGDAVVLRTGEGAGVVVDAGPDPGRVDRCLDQLGVEEVPLLVLTHFHADHVDGLPGVLAGRRVGAVEVTPVADPPGTARWVERVLAQRRLVAGASVHRSVRQVGEVRLRQVWPRAGAVARPGKAGEQANDASVVLLAEVGGLHVLLTGDVEPGAQRGLARDLADVQVDVLKVPHHGSRHQDEAFLAGLRARVALVSVGADNTYGHPSRELLDRFAAQGTRVLRTDRGSDVVVAVREGQLVTTSLR